ncbi:PASTA domain-containing protein [Streptomyces sp. NPDC048483]|uniref:PASTA domain-containing protein n=1 Tax=Streptomyces sp. NPDC048483 TaxID=3154927 RepID=UPI00342A904A
MVKRACPRTKQTHCQPIARERQQVNPYNTPQPLSPAPQPWWKTTPTAIVMIALVAVLAAISFPLGALAMIAVIVLLWVLPPWKWGMKLGATIGTFLLLTVAAGLSGQLDETGKDKPKPVAAKTHEPATTPTPAKAKAPKAKAPDYTGKPLDKAEEQARAAGYTTGAHDASPKDRNIFMRSGWVVCFQKPDTDDGHKLIDFGAMKDGEPCPNKDGGPIPWPTMPDLKGKTWEAATGALNGLGVKQDSIRADTAYANDTLPTEGEYDDWKVCATDPAEGEDIDTSSTSAVTLDLTAPGNGCPGSEYANLPDKDDDGTPDYRDKRDDRDDRDTTGSGGSTSSGGSSSGGGGSVGTVTPGSFCSHAGATGTSHGRIYTCKGPGQNRWRQ